jgi:hypothetical protein
MGQAKWGRVAALTQEELRLRPEAMSVVVLSSQWTKSLAFGPKP